MSLAIDRPGLKFRAIEWDQFSARPKSALFGRISNKLRWPLGIYTTPVALLVVWQLASIAGLLPSDWAPAPTAILASGYELYEKGELIPSLGISLTRAGTGLALGLAIGVTLGVLGGLLKSGEYLFNGLFQIFVRRWPTVRCALRGGDLHRSSEL